MKHRLWRMGISLLTALLMLTQGLTLNGIAAEGAVAEPVEKEVMTFSAVEKTHRWLQWGWSFYTNWTTGDGLSGDQGVDLSGTADNGANKKMTFRASVTLEALDPAVDVTTAWKKLSFRLRSGRVNGAEQEANFYDLTPNDVTMVDGSFEVAVPLSEVGKANIDWSDVRQLNITCEVADAYRLETGADSDQLALTLSNVRVTRTVTEGEVDTDELRDLVELAIREDEYQLAAVEAFRAAQEAGRQVLLNENITQEQVDEAVAALKLARAELEKAVLVYRESLQALVTESIDATPYTSDSFAAYQAAVNSGAAVLKNENATQKQVNDAVLAIAKAKVTLIESVAHVVYEPVLTFSGGTVTKDDLMYGTTFYPGWIRGDGLPNDSGTGKGMDLSGDAANGSTDDLYLQLKVTFPAFRDGVDTSYSMNKINIRLRSAKVDGAEMASTSYSLCRELLHPDEQDVFTIRLPLRLLQTGKLDWTDVRELFITIDVNDGFYATDAQGNRQTGLSKLVGFAMGDVAIVRKNPIVYGDVDGQDGVAAADALLTLQAATQKISLTAIRQLAADVDGNSGLSAGDALLILQLATRKISTDSVQGNAYEEEVFVTIPSSITEEIDEICAGLQDRPALAEMFRKCFVNTLETTTQLLPDGSTFIITGDIPAMWLRDSSAQVHQYLPFAGEDPDVQRIIAGLIKRQMQYIAIDPYANAFNLEANGRCYRKDSPDQSPWVWERKYEIDSLCYPFQLAYEYWQETGDTGIFDENFQNAVRIVMDLWKVEQHHENSPYTFNRSNTELPNNGKGTPVAYTGMTWSGFRPSDDPCTYGYLIPSNMFAVVVLGYLNEIETTVYENEVLAQEITALQKQIDDGIQQYGIVEVEGYGKIYAYEVDGMGHYNLMDDANVPSLLSIPYLGYRSADDPIVQNTRRFILSHDNPYYVEGEYASGIGSPHTPQGRFWPIALTIQALTSTDEEEVERILDMLVNTTGGTGYMHESVDPNDPTKYSRPWFAWANSLFGELVYTWATAQ